MLTSTLTPSSGFVNGSCGHLHASPTLRVTPDRVRLEVEGSRRRVHQSRAVVNLISGRPILTAHQDFAVRCQSPSSHGRLTLPLRSRRRKTVLGRLFTGRVVVDRSCQIYSEARFVRGRAFPRTDAEGRGEHRPRCFEIWWSDLAHTTLEHAASAAALWPDMWVHATANGRGLLSCCRYATSYASRYFVLMKVRSTSIARVWGPRTFPAVPLRGGRAARKTSGSR